MVPDFVLRRWNTKDIGLAVSDRAWADRVAEALESGDIGVEDFGRDENEVIFHLLRSTVRVLILDLGVCGARAARFLCLLESLRPGLSVLLLAGDPVRAAAAGVEVGGCVRHLFLELPGDGDLEDFARAALESQRRHLEMLRTG